ncbi:MAG: TAXI family TRAP transporter solute-binding subunit [Magnetococcales bacterium]|nr:TAXI family TRAP transporter solute-binding subunit [Magnetococcales bacterium]
MFRRSRVKRLFIHFLMATALMLGACSQSEEKTDGKKEGSAESTAIPESRFVTIGTGGVTGVYYPAGGAICQMVNKGQGSSGIRCNVESTGGSVYNVNSLLAGEMEFGVSQADVVYKARVGQEPFNSKRSTLRSLFSLHTEVVTLTSRADSNIEKIADMRGKRINIGNPGSGNERTARELLFVCGIKEDELALAGRLKASEMPDAIRDSKLDAYFYVVGHPTANIKDVSSSLPVRIVPLQGNCVNTIIKTQPYFVPASIPGGLYTGVDEDVPSYGVKATIVSSTKVPEEVVYEVVRAVFENLKDFRLQHPAFKDLDHTNMLQGLTAPLHPGALRYYQEMGWK